MSSSKPKSVPPENKKESKDIKAFMVLWFTKVKSLFLAYPRAASAILLGVIFILVVSTTFGGSSSASSSFISSNSIPSSSISSSESSSSSSTLQEVTLMFDTQGGSSIGPLTGLPGASIDQSSLTVTKVGHTFVSFSTSLSGEDSITLNVFPSSSMTIYVLWQAQQFNVNYYDVASSPSSIHSGGFNNDTHTFVVTVDGSLFAWGDNTSKQLTNSIQDNSVNQPVDITDAFGLQDGEAIEDAKAVAGSFDDGSSVVLTTIGRVFTFGANDVGQLGNGSTSSFIGNPQDITANFALEENEIISNIYTAIKVVFVKTNLNRFFAWGLGGSGYSSIPGQTTIKNLPMVVDFATLGSFVGGESVSNLFLNYYNGFITTSTGRVFGWGSSSWGQLPNQNGHVTNLREFTNDYVLEENDRVQSISIGNRHVVVLVENSVTFEQKVYSHGQHGDFVGFSSIRGGNTYYDSVPYNITSVVGLQEGESIISIHAQGLYTYFLLNTGELVEITKTNGTLENRIQILLSVLDEFQFGILSFSIGPSETFLLITHAFNLFTWGSNNGFSLGSGTPDSSFNRATPLKITARLTSPSFVQSVATDYGTTISLITPVKEGYTFAGWFEDRYLTIPYVEKTMPLNDLDLYASWTIQVG